MHNDAKNRINHWLLPALVFLIALELLLLPWAVGFAWANRSEDPTHVLTYTENKLTWDSATGIREDGTAILDIFDPEYDGTVQSADGSNVVAPGTAKNAFVRLQNQESGPVTFTAVLYCLTTDEALPITPILTGAHLEDTDTYAMPAGVTDAQVLRAVTGTVDGHMLQDLDIDWGWNFEVSPEGDRADTELGNRQPLDQITLGLYIVVEDDNSYLTPETPPTGDSAPLALYFTLMAISLLALVVLLLLRRRERTCENR